MIKTNKVNHLQLDKTQIEVSGEGVCNVYKKYLRESNLSNKFRW